MRLVYNVHRVREATLLVTTHLQCVKLKLPAFHTRIQIILRWLRRYFAVHDCNAFCGCGPCIYTYIPTKKIDGGFWTRKISKPDINVGHGFLKIAALFFHLILRKLWFIIKIQIVIYRVIKNRKKVLVNTSWRQPTAR